MVKVTVSLKVIFRLEVSLLICCWGVGDLPKVLFVHKKQKSVRHNSQQSQAVNTQSQSTETIPFKTLHNSTHTQTVFRREMSIIESVKWWIPAGLQAGTDACVFTGTKHFWNSLKNTVMSHRKDLPERNLISNEEIPDSQISLQLCMCYNKKVNTSDKFPNGRSDFIP